MNLPLKVKLKVILLILLNTHLNNNSRSEVIQIFKHYCQRKGEKHVASPPKVSKVKEMSAKGQKAAPKLVVNQNATKCALLADETASTSGEEHVASPPKLSKVKEISTKGQKAAPNLVAEMSVIPQKASALPDEGAIACNSDLDGEDYYIVKDANESTSSKYVPCVNYPNDKVYPEDKKNAWVRLEEDTGLPNIYI